MYTDDVVRCPICGEELYDGMRIYSNEDDEVFACELCVVITLA